MTDLTPLATTDLTDPFVAAPAAADVTLLVGPAGHVALVLSPAALDALDSYLDAMPLYHDLIDGGGYDPAAADLMVTLRAAIGRHVRPGM